MPKPHSEFQINMAFYDAIDDDDARIRDYHRMYVRKDGKFIPTGYAIQYVKTSYDRDLARWSTIRLTKYFSDSDLGI